MIDLFVILAIAILVFKTVVTSTMIVSVLLLRHAAVMQQSCGPRAGW